MRNLKEVKGQTMLVFGVLEYFSLREQKVQDTEGGICLT